MKRFVAIFLLLLPAIPSNAQRWDVFETDTSCHSFSPELLVGPGVIATFGLITHYCAHDTWDWGIMNEVTSWERNFPKLEDWVQYLPAATYLGLGATGVPCRHGFVDRLIEATLAYAICAAVTIPSKYIFRTLRPNESNYRSFPSGHAATAFTGAELIRMDYGLLWGAGAWGLAGGVGFLRIYHNYHWFSDILLGAAIGILAARAGGWLLEPVKSLLHINTSGSKEIALLPVVDPLSRSVSLSFGMTF